MDFAKPVKAISLPQDVPSTSDHHLIVLGNQVQLLMEAHLSPKQSVQVNKITSSCEICSGPHDTQSCMENPEQAFVDYASSCIDKVGGKWFTFKPEQNNLGDTYNPSWRSHPNLRPRNPLLVGRGFLATANAVIDCRKAKIAVGEGITRSVFGVKEIDPGEEDAPYWTTEWELTRDAEINPFKDVLVFRRMVEFLGALPINLKGNMWESEDLKENPIKWDKPPKNRDGAWHAKIRLIDPDGEEFTKTFQSIPTSRKISEKENPREIIDLDHFHDT
ncbi:hypothetical protein Tco_0650107 [Tanacetum coccineum]